MDDWLLKSGSWMRFLGQINQPACKEVIGRFVPQEGAAALNASYGHDPLRRIGTDPVSAQRANGFSTKMRRAASPELRRSSL